MTLNLGVSVEGVDLSLQFRQRPHRTATFPRYPRRLFR